MTDTAELELVPLKKREEFLRDGALNAMWLAHSMHLSVTAISEAQLRESSVPQQAFAGAARKHLENRRDEQMLRALEELEQWAGHKGLRSSS